MFQSELKLSMIYLLLRAHHWLMFSFQSVVTSGYFPGVSPPSLFFFAVCLDQCRVVQSLVLAESHGDFSVCFHSLSRLFYISFVFLLFLQLLLSWHLVQI